MSSGAFKFEMAKRLVGQFIAVCMYFSVFGIIAALVFAWITGKDGKEQFNFIVSVIGGLIVGFIYMGFTVVPFIKEYRDWRPDFYLSCLWKLRVNSVKQSPELLALLRELESKAIVLESREGKLLVKPKKNVTPEIIGKLTKHKAALLRMLK